MWHSITTLVIFHQWIVHIHYPHYIIIQTNYLHNLSMNYRSGCPWIITFIMNYYRSQWKSINYPLIISKRLGFRLRSAVSWVLLTAPRSLWRCRGWSSNLPRWPAPRKANWWRSHGIINVIPNYTKLYHLTSFHIYIYMHIYFQKYMSKYDISQELG